MLYTISINRKPVSWNKAYRRLKGAGMFMTSEGKQYKHFVMMSTRSQVKDFQVIPDHVLRATLVVCLPDVITKKGKPSKTAGDGDNYSKLTLDAVCKELKIDDSIIWDTRIVKVYQETARVFIELKWDKLDGYFFPYRFIAESYGIQTSVGRT